MVCVVVVMVRGGVVYCMSVVVIVVVYVVSVYVVMVLGSSGGVCKSERVCTDVCVGVRWVYHNYGEK